VLFRGRFSAAVEKDLYRLAYDLAKADWSGSQEEARVGVIEG
jgi:hypothetical protein